jgi:hypothetical protein
MRGVGSGLAQIKFSLLKIFHDVPCAGNPLVQLISHSSILSLIKCSFLKSFIFQSNLGTQNKKCKIKPQRKIKKNPVMTEVNKQTNKKKWLSFTLPKIIWLIQTGLSFSSEELDILFGQNGQMTCKKR